MTRGLSDRLSGGSRELALTLALALMPTACERGSTDGTASAGDPRGPVQVRHRAPGMALGEANDSVPARPPEAPGEPLGPEERADVLLVEGVVGARFDPVEEALIAVDEAVERDLPVRAAQIIEASVLPASRTLLARLAEIDPETELGVTLRAAWLEACQARELALVAYGDALGRGIVEDLTLADALRDQRRAGERVARARAAHAAARRRIDASNEGE